MTCRDCIHYSICSLWSTSDLEEDEAHKFCFGNFKSIEDMPKVVKCKDCKNYGEFTFCDYFGLYGFCSYGERINI